MKLGRQPNRDNATASVMTGFSLVEFMVAMVLGFIVVGGAISVYLTSKNSFTEGEQVAQLADNARFALQVMGNSSRHIGFFGGPQAGDLEQDANLGVVSGDCTGAGAAYGGAPLRGLVAVRANSAAVLGCITDAKPDTDVLIIKGVIPDPLYDFNPDDPNVPLDGEIDGLDDKEVYVVANSVRGMLFDGADAPPSVAEGQDYAFGAAWRYRMQIFYVRDGDVPTLSRKVLGWSDDDGAMALDTEDLIHGVENIRFLFTFDSTGDSVADTIADEAGVTSANGWDRVTSMQIYLLLRADEADPSYTNSNTYNLGGEELRFNDNTRRLLLHQEVSLRNPRLVIVGGPS
ncbi:MAG: PilW family protein [Halioglobus sp.]|nr:PilW family protein [Halioglobus sp.]